MRIVQKAIIFTLKEGPLLNTFVAATYCYFL